VRERGVVPVKGKGDMLTSFVLGRKITRGPLGRTLRGDNAFAAAGGGGLAEVGFGMVRARKRKNGRRGEAKSGQIHPHL